MKEGSTQTIEKKAHTYGDWKVTKEATCTTAGSREKVCSTCGNKVTETIAALGHTWNTDYTIDKEATCSAEGSKSIHCSVCNAMKEGSTQTIEKKAHTYGDWKITKEATCTTEGSREKVCSVCKDKVTETIAALGHTWNTDYTIDKEATCSAEGSKSIHCSVCDAVKDDTTQTIEKTSHAFDDWKVTTVATTETEGQEARTCSICGETETRTIPIIKHLFNDVQREDAWYYTPVYEIAETHNANGTALMSGYADGSNNFGPTDPLTRQDFAVILYRLAGEPGVENTENPYPDVDQKGYYYTSVLWAKENSVITGYENGKFGVGDNITREQVATILYRYAKDYKNLDTEAAYLAGDLSKFKDKESVSGFAKDALIWAVGAKVISGKDNGTRIDPRGNAARSEIGAMILRFIAYMDSVE